MGIDHSFSNEYNQFKKDHIEISQTKNQWGNVIFLQSKFSQQHKCVEKIIRFQDEQEYQKYRQIIKSFQNFKNQNCAKILTFSEGSEGLCANPGLSIAVILECPQTSLQDIILKQNINQQGENKFLEQDDFLTIFNQLIDILYSLYLFDLPLGEISPDNIFITDEGVIKYVNSFILTAKKSSIDYLKNDDVFRSSYAPEEFLIMKFKTQESIIDFDSQKKAIFSFGITLLSLLTSSDYKIFYDYEDCNIKFDKIAKILNQLEQQGYNQQLDQILIEMLSREPYERPSLNEIKNRLDHMQMKNMTRLSTRFMSKVNQLKPIIFICHYDILTLQFQFKFKNNDQFYQEFQP